MSARPYPPPGPPLRVAPNPAEVARYRALFPDDLAAAATLCERVSASFGAQRLAAARCLDLQTRAGDLAAALRARGAADVWACASAAEALYSGGAHHLVRADLASLPDHPDVRADAATFDLIACASGLHWALPLAAPLMPLAWGALAALLAPGGRLLLTWPARRPPQRPRWRALGGGVGALDQRLGDTTHWQCRVGPSLAPWTRQGACLSVRACARALQAAGFTSVGARALTPDSVCIEAMR